MATLNPSPRAVDFMARLETRAGLNSRLSDPDSWGDVPRAKDAVATAHKAVNDAVKIVDRLTHDTTRTAPQLHDRARRAITEGCATMLQVGEKLATLADEHEAKAVAAVDEYANLEAVPQTLLALKIQWIKDKYATEGGTNEIRKVVGTDPHLGAIFGRVDSYIMGVNEDFRQSMMDFAISKWTPDAKRMQGVADRLRETAAKYPKTAADLHNSAYLPGVADQMQSRVED